MPHSKANKEDNKHFNCFSTSRPRAKIDCGKVEDQPPPSTTPTINHTRQVKYIPIKKRKTKKSQFWLINVLNHTHNHNYLCSAHNPSECTLETKRKNMNLRNLRNSFQIPKLPAILILQSKANNNDYNHINSFSSSRPKPMIDCKNLEDKPHHQPYPQGFTQYKWIHTSGCG